jgi:hypothetical protein
MRRDSFASWRDCCIARLSEIRGGEMAMYPYVAPHTSKIHTLITLGIRHRVKVLVSKPRKPLDAWARFPSPAPFSLVWGVPALS